MSFAFWRCINMSRITPTVVGTWSFSAEPVRKAIQLVSSGASSIESIETAINVAEEDESYGQYSVGKGGGRNAQGELELDAAIMDGKNLNFGAVTALQGVTRAISVARCVMEKSPHSMLTGIGALDFALQQGFHNHQLSVNCPVRVGLPMSVDTESAPILQQKFGHDTLGLIVCDTYGNIGAGVSTSGMAGKARGRVGDSALPGSGLYADNDAGAACCTGNGDQIMKFCPSFHAVQLLKQGQSPGEACQNVVRNMVRRAGSPASVEIGLIAVNTMGEVGAGTTVREWLDSRTGHLYPGFPFTVWTHRQTSAEPEIHVAKQIHV